jgi:hypothetical protein
LLKTQQEYVRDMAKKRIRLSPGILSYVNNRKARLVRFGRTPEAVETNKERPQRY